MTSKNSGQIHILITEPEYFTPQSVRRMRKVGIVIARRMTRKELLVAVKNVEVLVVRIETIVNKDLVRHAEKLRCVVSATTGLNHIDTSLLKSRGVALFSLHGEHSASTAEHAIALMFAIARNIPAAHQNIMANQWTRWDFIGNELIGKTLGIFGIGRVGTQVTLRAKGLGMNVIAYDPYLDKDEVLNRGGQKVNWATFLKKSDFITLHAPLTEETEGLFDTITIGKMKRGVILINTARGAIIDEISLLAALTKGTVRGAAIDVYPIEPIPKENRLRQYAQTHQNLILTPHLGASTDEALTKASQFAAESVEKFLRGSCGFYVFLLYFFNL